MDSNGNPELAKKKQIQKYATSLLLNDNGLVGNEKYQPAHKVLLFVAIILAAFGIIPAGIFITSEVIGLKLWVLVGLLLIILVVILICLWDLKFIFPAQDSTGDGTMGFRKCKFLCWKEFTWTIFVVLGIIMALAGFLSISGFLAIYIRYGYYIRVYFWSFLVEIMFMSVMTAIPIVLISYNRGGQSWELLLEVAVISGKFGGLHIMMEMCGFYNAIFSQKERFYIVGKNLASLDSNQIAQLVATQLAEQSVDGAGHERLLLGILASVFGATIIFVGWVLWSSSRRRKTVKMQGMQEEYADKMQWRSTNGRMKAMLILSVLLGALMLIVVVLGLRQDSEWAATYKSIGETWTNVGSAGIMAALAIGVFSVSFVAIKTRYAGFINHMPLTFLSELFVVMFLSIVPLGYISYNRGSDHLDVALELAILALKFGGLHLLLELSGFYASALHGRYHLDIVGNLPGAPDWTSIDNERKSKVFTKTSKVTVPDCSSVKPANLSSGPALSTSVTVLKGKTKIVIPGPPPRRNSLV